MTDEARPAGEDAKALFFELAANRDPGVRDRLVTLHLGLAHQLARRYANRGEPYEDLVQVASMAIVKSVDRFDPDRGVEFTTFATRTVIGELKRHFRDKGWAVRAPRRVQELYLELGKVTESLSQELGRSPTVAELAAATGATEEAVLEALEAGQGYRTSSIDATDRNEETLASHIGGDDASLGTVEDRELLAPALAKLAPREQVILQLRFAQGLTQSEIAARVGISQMHVSRLLAASLDRLRKSVTESNGNAEGEADGEEERGDGHPATPPQGTAREGSAAS
jgi:RNA polymerase sigma-B factor